MFKKTMMTLVVSLFLIELAVASVKTSDLSFYYTGIKAKKMYQSLNVSEQVEKFDALDGNTRYTPKTYKIGKNVVCVKSNKSSYFCSTSINSSGEVETSE